MTPHFHANELACKCGCGMLPQQDFMDKVEALRVAAGFAFPVTSAARCPTHNDRVSSTGYHGPHTTGRAIDIGVDSGRAFILIALAMKHGFSGIGVKQHGSGRFVHLDDLPIADGRLRPTIWSYP